MQLNTVAARGLVAAVAASMIGAGLVGVAHADTAAKAVVVSADVTAGFTGSTTITVQNLSGANITAVRILPPLDGAGQVVGTLNSGAAGTGGSGWDVARSSDTKGWKFSAKAPAASPLPIGSSSKGLAPSSASPPAVATFTLPITYATPAVDTMARWRVQTSTNDGASYTDAAGGAGSALVQTIRVLTISTPAINFVRTAPNRVTANQNNRVLTYTVTYLGSGSMDVSTSASNITGDSSPTQSALLTTTARNLNYSATASFPAASTTQRALTATATGVMTGVGSANAIAATSALYTVQEPAVVTVSACAPGTVSGNFLFAPTATVTQNGSTATGDNTVDSVSLATDGITLDFGTATTPSTATLRTSRTTAKGGTTTLVPFADVKSINPAADQTTAISYTVRGVDANGADVVSGPLPCGALSIDVTAPTASATLTTGFKQPTAVGQTRANADGPQVATHGSKITVSGTVSNGQATTVTCTLFAYNDLGQPAGSAPDVNCPLTGDTFTATITAPNFALSATSAKVRLTTADGVGNTTVSWSSPILVDPLVPIFDDVTSTTVNPTTIKLYLDELTAGSFSPQEFTVMAGTTRHFVETVVADGNTGSTVGFSRVLTLTLRSELGEDDMPTVTYRPFAAGTTAAADGAGNLMASVDVTKPGSAVTVVDGIVPAIPALATVDGKGPRLAANTYYVNVTRPVFSVTGVSDNHTVEIYHDINTNDVVDDGDRLICSQQSAGASEVLCTPSGAQALAANGDDHAVLVVARDGAGNVSAPELSRVTVDTILEISVTRVGGDLLVNFGEIVEGRDFADDWYVTDATGGASSPLSVVSEAAGTKRRLVFAAGDPVLTGPVTLTYAPAGAGTARYTDLAGNTAPDRSFTGI